MRPVPEGMGRMAGFATLARFQRQSRRMTTSDASTSRRLPLHWKMLIGFLAGLVFGLAVHAGAGADADWVQWITSHVTQPAGTCSCG
jgi:hypothetical protein